MEKRKSWVLVVEDEPDLAEILTGGLRKQGFQVVCCATAARALQLLLNQKFDCLVLDMKLEEGTGEQIIRTLRRDARHINRWSPIIVTSGHLDSELVKRISKDIDGALVKPYSRDALIEKVASFCADGRLHGEH